MRDVKFNYLTDRPTAICPVCNSEVPIPIGDANVCPKCGLTVVDYQGNFFGYVTEPYFKNIWISKALIKKGVFAETFAKDISINRELLNELKEKWRKRNESE